MIASFLLELVLLPLEIAVRIFAVLFTVIFGV